VDPRLMRLASRHLGDLVFFRRYAVDEASTPLLSVYERGFWYLGALRRENRAVYTACHHAKRVVHAVCWARCNSSLGLHMAASGDTGAYCSFSAQQPVTCKAVEPLWRSLMLLSPAPASSNVSPGMIDDR
jgi:hypothetical protein